MSRIADFRGLLPLTTRSPGVTHILLVARHALVRAGLRALMDATPELEVVAEAVDLTEAAEIAIAAQPHVILLDASAESDEAALHRLRAAAPHACVLSLTEERWCGASSVRCLPRDAGVGELCATVEALLGARCGSCIQQPGCVLSAPRAQVKLSPREKQVAVHVAAGLASKQIAAVLGISLRTVNTYRESLRRKLGSSSAALLTRYVLQHGLQAE